MSPEDARDLCTDAVFERGENYYREGRVHEISRVGDTVTATVQGSQRYDLRLSIDEPGFDPRCSCPYSGPGECKHVVAVLLSLADELPPDEGDRIDAVLDDVDDADLRGFVRDELAREEGMRDRFLARFGTGPGKSHNEYRENVEQLFEEATQDYPVVTGAIDFSQFTDLGEQYRERGRYRQAAAVYRGLLEGIDDNDPLVEGAYDHYARVLTEALDAYVDCVIEADLPASERERYEAFLAERAESGPGSYREQFRRALSDLDSRVEG